MNINQIAEKNKDELPGYKLAGYVELGFPVFQCILYCLMLTDAQIPVIEEFILNLYSNGVELTDIPSILGIDFGLVEEAWTGLLQRDYINPVTREITTLGVEYLDNHKIEKLEKTSVPVLIDGLTNIVKPKSSQLMAGKNSKSLDIRTLRSTFDRPNLESINFDQVRNVIKEYQKIDKENYNGRILEIYNLDNQTTKYKRLNVLAYINDEKSVRLLVYDGFERIDGYENSLLSLENRGIPIYKYALGKYYNSDKINLIDRLLSKDYGSPQIIGPGRVWDLWIEYIEAAKTKILLVLPLIDLFTPTQTWQGIIEKALIKGINVSVVVSGREFANAYQKERYEELIRTKKRYRNFEIYQTSEYYNKLIIVDNSRGVISKFIKNDINLDTTKFVVEEQGYILNQQEISEIQDKLPSTTEFIYQGNDNISGLNKKWLNEKMLILLKLVNDFDAKLAILNNIGWIGEGKVPDSTSLITVPLAKDNELFITFINAINRSFVESLEVNGKSHGVKDYFWNYIRNSYPDLFHVLHKIKVYRNKADHLSLDIKNTEYYYQFLKEDLEGHIPDFVDNGYLIIQIKIINELENCLRVIVNEN